MSASAFFALKPGERVRIYWAKDDNSKDVRLDEIVIVTDANENAITTGNYEWSLDELIEPESNLLDTSRGYAYLYYPD